MECPRNRFHTGHCMGGEYHSTNKKQTPIATEFHVFESLNHSFEAIHQPQASNDPNLLPSCVCSRVHVQSSEVHILPVLSNFVGGAGIGGGGGGDHTIA